MSKYTFGKVPLMTVMLEHLIENRNVEGKVVGVFAGYVHPESDDSSDRLKWIWNTDPSKPGQHWILCILRKKSFKKPLLKNGDCKIYEYEIVDSWGPSFISKLKFSKT